MLQNDFFDQDASTVARSLLGKIIRRKVGRNWLAARIIETEAYYLEDKGSHSSLGLTHSRRAMFMPAGTIYMYYARGRASLNMSCRGEGNAVLVKSAYPYIDELSPQKSIEIMQGFYPREPDGKPRQVAHLCSGQTLLCQALDLKVADWNNRNFDAGKFYIEDVGYQPETLIQTTRLGIPRGRDEHLPYRFIDHDWASFCTRNPLTKRNAVEGKAYQLIRPGRNDYDRKNQQIRRRMA
jgi:DNA-3-methyladenine glycosylase